MSLAITFRFFVFSCLYAFSVCSTFILCFIIIYKHVHMCFSCYVHVCVCYFIVPVHPFPFLFSSHVCKEFCVCLLSHVYNFALYTHVSVCVNWLLIFIHFMYVRPIFYRIFIYLFILFHFYFVRMSVKNFVLVFYCMYITLPFICMYVCVCVCVCLYI